MATQRTLISSSIVATIVLLLSAIIPDTLAHEKEIKVTGKVGESASTIYVEHGTEVKLTCDLGGNVSTSANNPRPLWSFVKQGNRTHTDLASFCMQLVNKTISSSEQFAKCKVKFDEENKRSTLELERVTDASFGEYICHFKDEVSSEQPSKTFSVQELVSIQRLDHEKNIKSVIVTEGSPLELYCNITGLKEWHKFSWLKDGKDISKNLTQRTGLFNNFTHPNKTSTAEFYAGPARLEHRGIYTCRVDVDNNTSQISNKYDYPVIFKFNVKVHESDRWTVPAYILMGEIALIGAFTYFIERREKRLEDDDKMIEDSEADDDESNKQQTKNGGGGGQNNNSNNDNSKQ